MFAKYKKLIIGVIVIIAVFFLYSQFFGKDSDDTGLLTSNVSQGQQGSADILGADIIRAINQISSLDLDRSVFENPVLRRLVDRSEKINPEPIGRDNPFAPFNPIASVQNTIQPDISVTVPDPEGGLDEAAQN